MPQFTLTHGLVSVWFVYYKKIENMEKYVLIAKSK